MGIGSQSMIRYGMGAGVVVAVGGQKGGIEQTIETRMIREVFVVVRCRMFPIGIIIVKI